MSREKGMRDIPTVQGVTRRVKPRTREEAVTELARLEHEQARLERIERLWLESRKQAEEQLQKVKERILVVRESLYGPPANPHRAAAKAESGENSEPENKTWQHVSLEY